MVTMGNVSNGDTANKGDLLAKESIESVDTSIVVDTDKHKEYLRGLDEVKGLTDKIDVSNLNTILEFGKEASDGLSRTTDNLLANTKKIEADKMTKALINLTEVMDSCDLKSLSNAMDKDYKPSVLDKVKGYYKTLNKLISKYELDTKEIDKVKVILDGYKNDLRVSNMGLEQHKLELINYFTELEKYIVAGDIALEEIASIRGSIECATMNSGDKMVQLQALDLAKSTLEERLVNLKAAEAVALQSVPLIRVMQESNLYLYNKIETQFIITLPIFKSSLLQAIELRRQKAIADSLSKVDEVTNKLLEANASNTVKNSLAIQSMASRPTIKVETLENTYKTIQDGLVEIDKLNKDNEKARLDARVKLDSLKGNFSNKYLS